MKSSKKSNNIKLYFMEELIFILTDLEIENNKN